MTKKKNNIPTAAAQSADALIAAIVHGMEEVKAHDIRILDLRSIGHSSTDYYIVCHGNTSTQVKAIADSVDKHTFLQAQEEPLHTEGARNAQWILLDYGNVVVHIFEKETRSYYDLEELWGDAPVRSIEA